MAPPGRRRGTQRLRASLILILGTILLLLVPPSFAASAVLGLDLGTEYIKAALVKPGIPLEIVLTKDSKRKEAASIAFKASGISPSSEQTVEYPERLYGGDSLALAPRFPADVYPNLKHLLGVSGSHKDVAVNEYRRRYPSLALKTDIVNGTLGFQSASFQAEQPPFLVEELLAMQLKGIRENAEVFAGQGHKIRDAVITIPAFYTVDERRAIQLAAELAGLKTMALLSDGLAVGLNYATSRTFPNVTDGKKPEYHMVYDMGAGSTTATVLRFQGRTVKDVGRRNKTIQEVIVMGVGWDRGLGGDALNDLIVSDMVDKFVDTKGAKTQGLLADSVKGNGRTMAKIWREAEKLRQVLSANSETSANFEGLQEDVDFRYKLSRSSFEDLASTFKDRVGKPIRDALRNAALKVDDLDSIILHGGAVRTPFVQAALEDSAKNAAKVKGNVNADESAAFGAAFKAAGLSPSFRVKEIKANDAAAYPAVIEWSTKEKLRQQQIFTPTSSIGTVKQLPFNYHTDFSFAVRQEVLDSEGVKIAQKDIFSAEVTNLTASVAELIKSRGCDRAAINTTVSIRLDPQDCLPEVVSGTVSCEVEVTESKGVVEGVKGFFGFGSKKDQDPLSAEDNSTTTTVKPSEDTATNAAEASSSSSPKESEKSAKPIPKKKKEVIHLEIKVVREGSSQPSSADLQQIKERILSFDRSDEGRRLRDEQFNLLESFTYRTRDFLADETILDVSTKEQREAIEAELKSTGDWLYMDGAKASYEVVKEKLQTLKGMVDPVKKRKEENTNRPSAIQKLREALNQTEVLVKIVEREVEKARSSASLSSESSTDEPSIESLPTDAPTAAEVSQSPLADADRADSSDPSEETIGSAEEVPLEEASKDGLDDDGQTTSETPATSTKTFTSTKPAVTIDPSKYTEDDLTQLSAIHESVNKWLSEQSEAQDKLSASQDPVLLAADIDARAKMLNKASTDLLRRRNKLNDKSKSSTKSKSTTKTKSKSSSKASSKSATKSKGEPADDSSLSTTDASPEATSAAAEAEQQHQAEPRDEL